MGTPVSNRALFLDPFPCRTLQTLGPARAETPSTEAILQQQFDIPSGR
jgi:hypothetical protein